MSSEGLIFVERAAGLLHANGQTTERTVQQITRLAKAYGYQLSALPQWDFILLRFKPLDPKGEPWITAEIDTKPVSIDMNKVARLNQWIDQICEDPHRQLENHLNAARMRLDEISAALPSSNPKFVLMSGLGAAALAIIFGISAWPILGLIFLIAAIGAIARRAIAGFTHNLFMQPFVAALITGSAGGLLGGHVPDGSLLFIELAPCMILVPGAHMLNGSIDVFRGRLTLGTARLVYSGIILLSICTGLLLGLALTGDSLAAYTTAGGLNILALDLLAAGIAAASFGIFFSLRWSMLIVPVSVAVSCHAVRWWVLSQGGHVIEGALIACLIAGALMTFFSHRLKIPFAALAFTSVVSMMPGIFIFKFSNGLLGMYNSGTASTLALFNNTYHNGMTALLIVAAMTFGLLFPKLIIECIVAKKPR